VAEYIKGSTDGELDLDGLMQLKKRLFNRKIDPGKGEKTINEVTRMLQNAIFSYDISIIKNEERLTRAMKELQSMQEKELCPALLAQ